MDVATKMRSKVERGLDILRLSFIPTCTNFQSLDHLYIHRPTVLLPCYVTLILSFVGAVLATDIVLSKMCVGVHVCANQVGL